MQQIPKKLFSAEKCQSKGHKVIDLGVILKGNWTLVQYVCQIWSLDLRFTNYSEC